MPEPMEALTSQLTELGKQTTALRDYCIRRRLAT